MSLTTPYWIHRTDLCFNRILPQRKPLGLNHDKHNRGTAPLEGRTRSHLSWKNICVLNCVKPWRPTVVVWRPLFNRNYFANLKNYGAPTVWYTWAKSQGHTYFWYLLWYFSHEYLQVHSAQRCIQHLNWTFPPVHLSMCVLNNWDLPWISRCQLLIRLFTQQILDLTDVNIKTVPPVVKSILYCTRLSIWIWIQFCKDSNWSLSSTFSVCDKYLLLKYWQWIEAETNVDRWVGLKSFCSTTQRKISNGYASLQTWTLSF